MMRCLVFPFFFLFVSLLQAQTVLVKPYVQPGDGSALVGTDVKVLVWLTDQVPGSFTVEFGQDATMTQMAAVERTQLDFIPLPKPPTKPVFSLFDNVPITLEDVMKDALRSTSEQVGDREQHYYRYRATLRGLPFDADIQYRVRHGEAVVREGTFRTRSSALQPIRFVAVGDLATGQAAQKAVAFQIAQKEPQFLIALGDIVYSEGRVSEYMRHFWKTYNDVANPSAASGAPLMQSVPFYPVLGNHDADTSRLTDRPDALGAFYFFQVPQNGPGVGPWSTPLGKDVKAAETFRARASPAYPALGYYSFDAGAAHFLVLDSNSYTTAHFSKLIPWITQDLRRSRQRWKIVCFHAPAFHTSPQHYTTQQMRLLEPVFEAHGVDVVFSGHVHNYQRTKPLRFTPTPRLRDKRGRVDGEFRLDEQFDGVGDTTPDGVIHIVSGGGGATLYNSKDYAATVAQLEVENIGNWVPYTSKFIADRHSFSLVDVTTESFTLRQISSSGEEIDRFVITKP